MLTIQERILYGENCYNCGNPIRDWTYELENDGEPYCGECFKKFVTETILDNCDTKELIWLYKRYSGFAHPAVTVYDENANIIFNE